MRFRPESGITTALMDDGGLVLLSEQSGKLYRCNATAAAMWRALGQHDGQLDAATSIAEQYRVDSAHVRADLDLLVDRLQQAGLVRADS